MKVRDGLYREKDYGFLSVIKDRGWHLVDDLSDLNETTDGWGVQGNEIVFEGATFCVPMELML